MNPVRKEKKKKIIKKKISYFFFTAKFLNLSRICDTFQQIIALLILQDIPLSKSLQSWWQECSFPSFGCSSNTDCTQNSSSAKQSFALLWHLLEISLTQVQAVLFYFDRNNMLYKGVTGCILVDTCAKLLLSEGFWKEEKEAKVGWDEWCDCNERKKKRENRKLMLYTFFSQDQEMDVFSRNTSL